MDCWKYWPCRGSASGPRWGLCPQTPVIGSRSTRSPCAPRKLPMPPLVPVLWRRRWWTRFSNHISTNTFRASKTTTFSSQYQHHDISSRPLQHFIEVRCVWLADDVLASLSLCLSAVQCAALQLFASFVTLRSQSRDRTRLIMLLSLFLVRFSFNFSVCSMWWTKLATR